ncbi:hypothetical protein C366_00194 [Cryptococcus neoformans Tu401-1]|nr:hypothetical protein C366_00194 [Cryptococcus neoformans var. grubii Tu401-1]
MVSPPPPRPVHPFFQLSSVQSKRKRQAGPAVEDSARRTHNTPIRAGQDSKENTPFRGLNVEHALNGKEKTDETLDSTDDEEIVFTHASQAPSSSASIGTLSGGTSNRLKPKRARPSLPSPAPISSQATASSSSMNEVVDLSSDVDDREDPIPVARCSKRRIAAKGTVGSRSMLSKPKPLSRSTSWTESRGINEKEAIEILESTPSPVALKILPGPKNLGFGQETGKAAHPFFTQTHFQNGHGASTLSQERPPSMTAEDASVVETTMAPVEMDKQPPKFHSFFGMSNLDRAQEKLKDGWGKEEIEAPLPMRPWPNHIGGYCAPASEPKWTEKRREPAPVVKDDGFWEGAIGRSSTPAYQGIKLKAYEIPIFPHIAKHPSFSSIPSKCSSSSSNRALWSDRYRPLRASEVIGNEVEATYLRDWLSALAVGGQHGKGSKIVRQVVKKPRSALIDGFIVDDLGLYGDAPNSEEDGEDGRPHLEDLPDPPISHDLNARPDKYPSLASQLANTILLTGPTGSGKTAAVYAAAHELGWEVFEVYAGMGKRTGANLMKWVGELGKNHTVVSQDGRSQNPIDDNEKKGMSKGKGKGLSSFFDKGSFQSNKVSLSLGIASNPIDIESKGEGDKMPVIKAANISGGESGIKFKESLLLIDEADILFEEEGSFWPAVIALASESRRPIILTCNDHQRIPRPQLPLQAILQFHPIPSFIALPYLQAISSQESQLRRKPSNPCLETIFRGAIHQTSGKDVLSDQCLPPNGHERIPFFDLRQAMMQLQLGLTGQIPQRSCANKYGTREEDEKKDDLQLMTERMEVISFSDAFIDIRPKVLMELYDADKLQPTSDEELDVAALLKPEMDETYPTLAMIDRSSDIAGSLVEAVDGHLPPFSDLGLARAKYIRSILPLLDPLIPLSEPLLPHSTLFLYTLPTIQTILSADDIFETLEQQAVDRGDERTNPKTGKPMRRVAGYTYTRYWDLEGAEDEARGISRLIW